MGKLFLAVVTGVLSFSANIIAQELPVQPSSAWVDVGDAASWRRSTCSTKITPACYRNIVWSAAASHQIQQSHDFAVKFALHAVTQSIVNQEQSGADVNLSARDQQILNHWFNDLMSDYEKGKSLALNKGEKWSDISSVKLLAEILKTKKGPLPVLIGQEAVNRLNQLVQPYLLMNDQNQFYSLNLDSQRLGDVMADYQFVALRFKKFREAIDPALFPHLHMTALDDVPQIFSDQPEIKHFFEQEDQGKLLKLIYQELINSNQSTEKGFGKINDRIAELEKIFLEQAKAPQAEIDLTEIEREENREKIQNFEASLKIFASVASLIPNPKIQDAARKTHAVANVALQIYKASKNVDKLTKLALSANVIEAAVGVFSLFAGSGPDPMAVISQQIEQVQKSLELMHEQMLQNFEVVQLKLDQVYQTMVDGFGEIITNQQVSINRINDLNRKVDQLDRQITRIDHKLEEQFQKLSEELLALSSVRCYEARDWVKFKKLSDDDFADCAAKTILRAVSFSRNSNATGVLDADLELLSSNAEKLKAKDYALANLSAVIEDQDPVAKLSSIGIFSQLHFGAAVLPKYEIAGKIKFQSVPQPHYYLSATKALLEFMIKFPQQKNLVTDQGLRKLEDTGEEIATAIRKLRSQDFLDSLFARYQLELNALKMNLACLQKARLSDWNLQDFNSSFFGAAPDKTGFSVSRAKEQIPPGMEGQTRTLELDIPEKAFNDMARIALQMNLAPLKFTWKLDGQPDSQKNLWVNLTYQKEKRREVRPPHLRDGFDVPPAFEPYIEETGRLSAHMRIITEGFIGDLRILSCRSQTADSLWIGNYRREFDLRRQGGRTIEVLRKTEEHPRTNDDVLGNVWTDGNYDLRYHTNCAPSISDPAKLKSMIDAEWFRRQQETKTLLINALKGEEHGAYKTQADAVRQNTINLEGLRILVEKSAALGFASQMNSSEDFVQILEGSKKLKTLDEMRNFLSSAKGVNIIEDLLKDLEARRADVHSRLTEISKTIPETTSLADLENILARLKAMREPRTNRR